MAGPMKDAMQVGDWTVHPDTNCLVRDGLSYSVQPLSMDVLLHLAERPGAVVTAQELIDRYWPNRIVGDDAVHRRIADLRKKLGDDARQPTYIDSIPKRGYRLIADVRSVTDSLVAGSQSSAWRSPGRVALTCAAAMLGILVLVLAMTGSRETGRDTAIEAALAHLENDRSQDAYDALHPFIRQADEHIVSVLEKVALPVSILTEPAGVDVAYRYAGSTAEWISLGKTPVDDALLPRGHFKLRFRNDVFMNATNPGVTFNTTGQVTRVIELPDTDIPDDMVFVAGGKYRFGAWGFIEEADLGGFFIDRTEVTNGDYFEFVEAGGYLDKTIWEPLIAVSDGALSWQVIRERFTDLTGKAGPASWQFGSYTPGDDHLPVVGISWYEAAAYLASRKKALPSVQHWLRAALGPMEWKYPIARDLVPHSNIGGTALLPVGSRPGAESHGAFDLIGNANEWTMSKISGEPATIGSSFRDPSWSYNFPVRQDAMYRGSDVGFRGMRRTAQSKFEPVGDIDSFADFATSIRRVSDEMFEGMRLIYAYDEGAVTVADVVTAAEFESDHWIRRQVMIPTERENDPMPVSIYLPRRHKPPFQSVIYLPPADSWSPGFRSESVALQDYQVDFVPMAGRALIWPVYSGSAERYDNFHSVLGPQRASLALDRNRRIRNEIGRIIDYLESSEEFDGSKVALMGLSHGAVIASYNLATEKRLKAAILYSVGIAPPIPIFASPQNDPNVYWARVSQPTLIINGRYDPLRPHRFVLEPLVELLATPAEHKSGQLYEAGHWPLPRYQMMRDSLAWLDRYLGPVDGPAID